MENTDKLTHPIYSNIELHFLPHQRAYNTTTKIYCHISLTNSISIPIQNRKSINFDNFKLECKLGRKLNKNEITDYVDHNPSNHEISNLTLKTIQETKIPKFTILATIIDQECRIPRSYNTISKASKDTKVDRSLIRACINNQIDKAKGNDNNWYSFKSISNDSDVSELSLDKLTI